jgi:nicotinate-nucleotide adenylyltransferase
MRIGVFGGTFDPPHLAHLILAEQCREQARLDQVSFIPAARPPHKREPVLTPYAQRLEMLELAIAGQPAFQTDTLERDRPGPSYTADTLAELHRLHPAAEFFLLIGSDTLHDLPHWHAPQQVAELATLLVVARPGWQMLDAGEVARQMGLPPAGPLRYQVVEVPLLDISSRDLRRRAAAGRSVRYFVPRAVEAYMLDKRLYREGRKAPSEPGA